MAQLIREFERQNPDIAIVLDERPEVGSLVHDKYVTMLASGDPSVDIYSIDVIWPPEFAEAGWLEPLDDIFPPSEQEKYIPSMIDACTINGHIYGILGTMTLVYLFKERSTRKWWIRGTRNMVRISRSCAKLQRWIKVFMVIVLIGEGSKSLIVIC